MLAPHSNPGDEGRAGRWVAQPEGYRVFLPKPLPPDPPLRLEGELQARLSLADQALGRLDGSIEILPDADLFLLTYVRQEAVLSSRIEGTRSSLEDLLAAEARVLRSDLTDDTSEVINYVTAANEGLEAIRDEPLSIALIRRLHRTLLTGVRGSEQSPGDLRRNQVWIGSPRSKIREATFVPPPPQEVPDALQALEAYLGSNTTEIPALVRIGLAHAQFENIHPFRDGNGRIGRLLITLLLCRDRILRKPVLYLSWFFVRYRAEYYARLRGVHDEGRWEEWIAFFLQAVTEVSHSAVETTRRILALRERHRGLIAERLGAAAGSGHRALEGLFGQPFVTVASLRRATGLSYAAANNLISKLVEADILQERTGRRRNRVFAYGAYLRIFAEGPGAVEE